MARSLTSGLTPSRWVAAVFALSVVMIDDCMQDVVGIVPRQPAQDRLGRISLVGRAGAARCRAVVTVLINTSRSTGG